MTTRIPTPQQASTDYEAAKAANEAALILHRVEIDAKALKVQIDVQRQVKRSTAAERAHSIAD